MKGEGDHLAPTNGQSERLEAAHFAPNFLRAPTLAAQQ